MSIVRTFYGDKIKTFDTSVETTQTNIPKAVSILSGGKILIHPDLVPSVFQFTTNTAAANYINVTPVKTAFGAADGKPYYGIVFSAYESASPYRRSGILINTSTKTIVDSFSTADNITSESEIIKRYTGYSTGESIRCAASSTPYSIASYEGGSNIYSGNVTSHEPNNIIQYSKVSNNFTFNVVSNSDSVTVGNSRVIAGIQFFDDPTEPSPTTLNPIIEEIEETFDKMVGDFTQAYVSR